ncbi:HAD-IA family hydrolase [Candidatus Saccharibacteria bacterium]|nr:HAD-IA family hydrolase [Candidatus Saccharibacteria bacterium]
MTIRAIIFDCFGVLYANPVLVLASRCKTKDQSLEIQELGRALQSGLISLDAFIAKAARYTNSSDKDITELMQKSLVRYDEVFDYAWQLKERGYRLAVLSSIGSDSVSRLFTKMERTELFDAIVASGGTSASKPSPSAFEVTIDRLNVSPEESIMIDDWSVNIEAAKSVGLKGVEFISLTDCRRQVEELLNA